MRHSATHNRSTGMTIAALIALCLFAAPQWAVAQDPSAADETAESSEDIPPATGHDGRAYFYSHAEFDSINPWQWGDVVNFFRQNSINRWQSFHAMTDGRARRRLMRIMSMQYRDLMTLQAQSDSSIYELALKRLTAEDGAWGIIAQMDEATEPTQRQPLADALNLQVRRIIELSLQERAARIAQLEAALQAEKTKLQHDQTHVDALVDQQLQQWLRFSDGDIDASPEESAAVPDSPTTQPAGDNTATTQAHTPPAATPSAN